MKDKERGKVRLVLSKFYHGSAGALKCKSFWMYVSVFLSMILAFVWSSAAYAYGLVLILWEIELTKEVIYSVFSHIDQMIATVLLSLILLFWFCTLAYYSDWKGKYAFDDKMDVESLLNYSRVHFDYGYLMNATWEENVLPWEASIWNFFFNLFVTIILTAIISGVIIDTFSERRENKKMIKDDT